MYFVKSFYLTLLLLIQLGAMSYGIGTIAQETTEEIAPGIIHIHRYQQEPKENIHILKIDLTNRDISFQSVLSGEQLGHVERVSSMVKRTKAIAGVNGDYWSGDSIYAAPEGIMVSNGELITAPKSRTALGITKDNKVFIQKWSDKFEWDAEVVMLNQEKHHINLLNRWDLNEDSMILYTPRWSAYSFGTSRGMPEMELLFEKDMDSLPRTDRFPIRVQEKRWNRERLRVADEYFHPEKYYLLAARGTSAQWLKEKLSTSTSHMIPYDPTNGTSNDGALFPRINLKTNPGWSDIYNAISAGPLIVDAGTTYRDSMESFHTNPKAEDFTVAWKRNYYINRNPHAAAGITKDGKTLILMTVDGRQKEFSLGFTRDELAEYMISLGAYRAMGLDSGGSTSMVIKGKLLNHPSDDAKADGTNGVERKVINSLCIYHKQWKGKL